LGRYSRSHDIVVGTPLANRTRPELEGLIGYFVNTAAFRTDLSGARPSCAPCMRTECSCSAPHCAAPCRTSAGWLQHVMARADHSIMNPLRRLRACAESGDAGSPSFLGLLGRVKSVVLGAIEHADVPFTQVVQAARVPRSSAYTPIFLFFFFFFFFFFQTM